MASTPYVAASGAVVGSWVLLPVPLVVALLLVGLCIWKAHPALVLVAFMALTSAFGTTALAGLADPPTGPIKAWVTLMDDPRPFSAGGVRATVRYEGRRLEAQAYGRAAAKLDNLLAGESAYVSGTMRATNNDWHRWRHVVATLAVTEVHETSDAAVLSTFANRVRRLLASGAQGLTADDRSLFGGMVYGDDRHQSARLADDFRAAGLGHLLVVSGQNVAFVLALATPLLSRMRPGVRLLALLGVLGVFAVLTRFEPSVLRAVTMAGVAVVSAALGRPEAGRRTLAWAVAVVLVVDPFLIRSLAFQLSVCATAGLLWITPALTEKLPGPHVLRLAVATTAGAQLGVMPLLVAVFGSVPVAALPANVIAGPASAPVMMWGLTGGVAAGMTGGWLAWLIHRPTALLLWWVRQVAGAAAAAPPAALGATGATLLAIGVVLLLAPGLRTLRLQTLRTWRGTKSHMAWRGTQANPWWRSDAVQPSGGALPSEGALASPSHTGWRSAATPSQQNSVPSGCDTQSETAPGTCSRWPRALGGLLVVVVLVQSLMSASGPPSGWSQVEGADVFSAEDVQVVVLKQSRSPERLLQALRELGVRTPDVIVAAAGGASDARAVVALADRFPAVPVLAPPMHRVPRARTVREGATVGLGSARLRVLSHEPELVLQVYSASMHTPDLVNAPRNTP